MSSYYLLATVSNIVIGPGILILIGLFVYFVAILKSSNKNGLVVVTLDVIVGASVVYASFLDDLDVSVLKLTPSKCLK